MPTIKLHNGQGRLLNLVPEGRPEAVTQVIIKTNAPDDLDSFIAEWSQSIAPSTDPKAVADTIANNIVAMGWGIIVQGEQTIIRPSALSLRPEDVTTVLRFAPVVVDAEVYFCSSVSKPAGALRRSGGGSVVAYVNPLTNEEYHRDLNDALGRFQFAAVEQVQGVLDKLDGSRWQAVGIAAGDNNELSLIINRSSGHSVLADIVPELKQQNTVLDSGLLQCMQDIKKRIAPNSHVGSLILAARLLEQDTNKRFVHLAGLYYSA